MPAANQSAGNAGAGMSEVSAGLDLLSGVFGYLSSLKSASIAKSQAELITAEAEANAQRYQEQAAQFEAHEKVMYTASGVTLAGSPVDALANTARLANENANAIIMGGEVEAQNAKVSGVNDEMKGRDALVSGVDKAVGMGSGTGTNLGIIAQLSGGGN